MITVEVEVAGEFLVTWRTIDEDLFNAAKRALRCFLPRRDATYSGELRAWVVALHARAQLGEFINYMVEEHGARVEGWDDATAPATAPLAAAYAALHLLPDAPPQLVKAAYRCLAQLHHPDLPGGDVETMKRVNVAHEKIMRALPESRAA